MITLRILLSPGRRGRIVDASGRSVPQPLPAPVIGSSEPLRIILLDPSSLDPADPYGFDTGAPLRLTISGDWDPATIPVYATNALERTGVGTYDLADPSGTRTAEALALLGVLAERLCAWELTAYGGDPATEADWAHPLSVVQFDAPLRQRADSLGGDPAEAPAVDLRGPPGAPGKDADPSDADPYMDGAASAGSSDKLSRGDHVHPSDTSRIAKTGLQAMQGPLSITNPLGVSVGPAGDATIYANGYIAGQGNHVTSLRLPRTPSSAPPTNLALEPSIAPVFSASSTYAVGDYCTHEGLLYKCTTAVTTAGAWNAANWSAVAVTDEMGADTPLPFDAECEYVTFPSGAYIPTGIIGKGPVLQVDLEIRAPATFDTTGDFRFGTWSGNATSSMMMWMAISPRRFDFIIGSDSYISDFSAIVGQFGHVGYDGKNVYCGSEKAASGATGVFSSASDFTLGGLNGAASSGVSFDMASAKFAISGAIVRDFIPVRIGSGANAVGYLYDKISGRLFGSAVGSIPLVPGPDKATPTIATPGRIVELTASPAFTGTPTAPTANAGTNTTQIATTAFVQTAIAALRAELGLT